MHEECGRGVHAEQQWMARQAKEVRDDWATLRKDQPDQAMALRKQHVVRPKGERNFNQLVSMTKQITRSTQVALKQKMQEYTKRTFYNRYRGEGYADTEVEAMWVAATTPEMYRKKLAFKKGKVEWVWQPLARTASKKDILTDSLQGEVEQLHVSKDTAADMLLGKQGIHVDAGSLLDAGMPSDDDVFWGNDLRENEVPALGDGAKPTVASDSDAEEG